MNINKILSINEQRFKDIILKSASASLVRNEQIVSNEIKLDINTYHHSLMKNLIENKINEELYKKNKSDIINNLSWLRENISNQINSDFIANILIGFNLVP